MLHEDTPVSLPRRISPEIALNNIDFAHSLIPEVAFALSPDTESLTNTRVGLESYFNEWKSAVSDLLDSHLARKNFHIPHPQTDQEHLHDLIELSTLHQIQFFEALLDPSGKKAKIYRPTSTEIESIVSLVNPQLPEDDKSSSIIGQAFERYAPKHNDNLMILAPTLMLELLGVSEYQTHAPYAGKVNKITSEFYEKYFRSVPPELATNNSPDAYRKQTQVARFERMLHFNNFNVAFFGVANGNEALIDDHIKRWRDAPNVTRLFSTADKKIQRIGFDILNHDEVAPWLDQYNQLNIDQIYRHPELKGIAGQLFSFGSVYMDILENVKYLQAILGASHILKRNGRFTDDQALPTTYKSEVITFNTLHPQEPYGMFWRDWRTGETNPPSKLFYAMPIAHRYFYYHLAGFKPESFQYRDAIHLEKIITENPQVLLATNANSRKRPWLNKILDTYYQTTDKYDRVYHRTTQTLLKSREPMPILRLITNFLARSPAFAPKTEQ